MPDPVHPQTCPTPADFPTQTEREMLQLSLKSQNAKGADQGSEGDRRHLQRHMQKAGAPIALLVPPSCGGADRGPLWFPLQTPELSKHKHIKVCENLGRNQFEAGSAKSEVVGRAPLTRRELGRDLYDGIYLPATAYSLVGCFGNLPLAF